MQTKVKRWGNSAAVRLSSKLLAAANLDVNSPISVEVKGRKIIIEGTPEKKIKHLKLPFSKANLLSGLDSETAHADELASISAKEFGN